MILSMNKHGRAHRVLGSLLVLIVILPIYGNTHAATDSASKTPVYTTKVVTDPLLLDRVYKSMVGPEDYVKFSLTEDSSPELVWLTGARLRVLDETGKPASDEFICHTSLFAENESLMPEIPDQPDPHAHHHKPIEDEQHGLVGFKFFDINQGETDLKMPKGFGIPVLSNEPLVFNAMSMNHYAERDPFNIKIEAEFDFVRDNESVEEMKPLAYRILQLELTFDGRTGYHWMVSPGRWKYTTLFEGLDMFTEDVRVHMITAHLHPYAESIELIDLTEGQSVFKSFTKNFDTGVGIEKIEPYRSSEGFILEKDHRYELKAVYNNTTEKKIDAMAILYIFYHEPGFEKGALPQQI